MLEFMPESRGEALGVWVIGKFTNQDYEEVLVPRLRAVIQEQGRVRVLLYLTDGFQGWETEAIRTHPFGSEHKDDFQKIAVVGGSWWLKLEMKLFTPFLAGEVRNFSREQIGEAWEWIRS